MNFTFLHCADLHLGSPMLGLAEKDEAIARRFAAASREAFSDLVSRAIAAQVAFVAISGDVYDGEWRDTSIGLFFGREMARLARAHIPAFLIKGNHDAASVVTRTLTLPDNVREFSVMRAETQRIENLRVAVHGRSFPDRVVTENWATSYPSPIEGWFNIGLLHTSCDGRPGHATYAPCTAAELAARGYDYWALGHVHDYEILSRDPWIVFPGNLQGRSVRECGPRGAVLVDVADGRVTDVRRLVLDRARFAQVSVDLSGMTDETALLAHINQQVRPLVEAAEDRLLAVRVSLSGATALHNALAADRHRIADEVQATLHRTGEEVWLERLRLVTTSAVEATAALPDDFIAALDACADDPQTMRRAEEFVAAVRAKLPGTAGGDTLPAEMAALIAEAHTLAAARLSASGRD
jgi:DNA repair exonuclease SbcCD nuclease subunit